MKLERSPFKDYFAIHHGYESWYKDMPPCTEEAVDTLLQSGEAIGQYALPVIRPEGDMKIWMPQRVAERKQIEEKKIAKIREELSRM